MVAAKRIPGPTSNRFDTMAKAPCVVNRDPGNERKGSRSSSMGRRVGAKLHPLVDPSVLARPFGFGLLFNVCNLDRRNVGVPHFLIERRQVCLLELFPLRDARLHLLA